MKISKSLLPAAALVALFAGCQDEDFGYQANDIKYESEFKKAFGEIDPNQNWSMAQQVTAHVSGVEDGILEIYYSDPIGGQPIMLTQQKISGGSATVKFDVVKGTKQIFARINDGTGYYSMKSNFKIVDGVVNIAPTMTRIGDPQTGTSRVTKSQSYSITSSQVLDHSNQNIELSATAEGRQDSYIDGIYIDKRDGSQIAGSKGNINDYLTNGEFSNLYNLYNVLSDADERPEWYVKDLVHFFDVIDGEKPAFKEGENHIHLMREGETPHLEKDLVFEMQEDGPFCLDYFFKGTKYDNQFGYFYFKGELPTPEQFMTMPKFVLVDNMSNYTSTISVGCEAGETKTWNLLQSKAPNYTTGNLGSFDGTINSKEGTAESQYDTKIVGTRFQLTYFGEDGTDEIGTYTFPKDTKIGLFFIGNHDDGRDNEVISSISSLNLELFNECPHAASFKYNDQVIFAMEDMRWGGDADVNDAMFIANGKFKKDEIPPINPVKPTFPTWIVACEDLGGTFDYDFNDVVFGLRKEDKADSEESDLYLVPLAAGGTLKAELIYNTTNLGEIHKLLTGTENFTTPLNVGTGSTPDAGPAILLGIVEKSTSINECAQMINIQVTKDDATSENAKTYNVGYKFGKDYSAPQAIILPAGWDWPSEMTHIWDVYEGILTWAENAEVTTWCNTKKAGVTEFVHNPLPAVPTPSEGESSGDGEEGGSDTPSADPTLPNWDITVIGNASMEKFATQTLTVTIEGVDDYSGLTFGTYSNSVIRATKVEGQPNKITINGLANGTALLWIKMPADDTHKLTRKDYEIKVTNPLPIFSFKLGDTVINDGDTYTHTWNGGQDFVNGTLTLTKGSSYRVVVTSSNTSVVEASVQGINVKGAGTAEVTIKHQAGSDGSTTWEEVSMTFTVVINAPGTGGGENEPEKDPITAGTYNLEIPSSTTYTASWGATYQAYTMNVGDYSCPDGLTGKVTITLKDCPGNQLEIAPSTGNWLGRISFYNGDKTATQTLTNAQLKQLLAGDFNVINYASSDVVMTSFTLVVE